MQKTIINLRQRWIDLGSRLEIKEDLEKYFDQIVLNYSEENRHYHTLEHIADCLQEFDEIKHQSVNPHALELAIWYHDIVNDPKVDNNEEKSAEFAQQTIKLMELRDELGQEVYKLILATKHKGNNTNIDFQSLTDIDLSIFGQNQEVFDDYENKIRKEYTHMSEDAFTKGRNSVIRYFYNWERIYKTDYFYNKYEIQARKNLEQSLKRWQVQK